VLDDARLNRSLANDHLRMWPCLLCAAVLVCTVSVFPPVMHASSPEAAYHLAAAHNTVSRDRRFC